MKLALMISALMSAGLAFAGPVTSQSAAQDEVAASFDRMLAERTPSRPAPVARNDDDPLRLYVSAVLWDRQPTQCQFSRYGGALRPLAALQGAGGPRDPSYRD